MPAKPSKRPKTLTKADAEAAAAKSLRKSLGREPLPDELAAGVRIYRQTYKNTAKTVSAALKRPKRG